MTRACVSHDPSAPTVPACAQFDAAQRVSEQQRSAAEEAAEKHLKEKLKKQRLEEENKVGEGNGGAGVCGGVNESVLHPPPIGKRAAPPPSYT